MMLKHRLQHVWQQWATNVPSTCSTNIGSIMLIWTSGASAHSNKQVASQLARHVVMMSLLHWLLHAAPATGDFELCKPAS